jgi:hypothetical protein
MRGSRACCKVRKCDSVIFNTHWWGDKTGNYTFRFKIVPLEGFVLQRLEPRDN